MALPQGQLSHAFLRETASRDKPSSPQPQETITGERAKRRAKVCAEREESQGKRPERREKRRHVPREKREEERGSQEQTREWTCRRARREREKVTLSNILAGTCRSRFVKRGGAQHNEGRERRRARTEEESGMSDRTHSASALHVHSAAPLPCFEPLLSHHLPSELSLDCVAVDSSSLFLAAGGSVAPLCFGVEVCVRCVPRAWEEPDSSE